MMQGVDGERAAGARTARSPGDLDAMYAGAPPWDIGRPQPAFLELADAGALQGRVPDGRAGDPYARAAEYLAEHPPACSAGQNGSWVERKLRPGVSCSWWWYGAWSRGSS